MYAPRMRHFASTRSITGRPTLARAAIGLLGLAALVMACTPGASEPPGGSAPSPAGDALAGTSWVLTSIGDTPLPPGANVTLALTADQATGIAACNQYGGAYSVDGNSIAFTAMSMTEMACAEPLMAVEAAYLAALAAATTWAVPADAPIGTQLTISGADPSTKLVFGPGR